MSDIVRTDFGLVIGSQSTRTRHVCRVLTQKHIQRDLLLKHKLLVANQLPAKRRPQASYYIRHAAYQLCYLISQ